jgi:Family of unknown function (DUF6941)
MNITLVLADSAQAVNGKLYILGGGWIDTTPGPDGHTPPHALAAIIHVPWDQANRPHHAVIRLLDADGHAVEPAENQPLRLDSDFEVGRPPGAQAGVALPVPLALNIGPMPLVPGRYMWELTVDDDPRWRAEVGFAVRTPGGPVRIAS